MVKRPRESLPMLEDAKRPSFYGTTIQSDPIRSERRLTYPKAVLFVLVSKFFEAFAANGVRTILALYLRDSLNFSEESSTSFYHIFNFFSQFCPIFGAILADSYFGNVKTIFYTFFIYACGWIGMVILTLPLQNVPITPLVIASLLLISIGNGSLRACVTSLGGSQFKMPDQAKELDQYFSHYYFVYTLGIMISKVIPPEIRAQTHCFGKNECYAAVFGSLAIIFLISWIIFVMGLCLYKDEEIDESDGNVMFQVVGCVYNGVRQKLKGDYIRLVSNNPWIDGAVGKYTESFIRDVSAFLKVLKLFIPLPLYWSLFAQIDSSWTFQASQLDTTVWGYKFEADQAKAVGALLLLLMIPIWQSIIIPLLLYYNIEIAPLKSITMGGISAAFSFICAGILQLKIEKHLLENSGTKISILWQFPQFILIMLGEVWLSIPGLTFSFTEAPQSMKSIITAAWFCNSAFGNLIVVAITEMHLFKLQSSSYFLYSGLMFLAIFLFCWIASTYKRLINQPNGDLNKLPYSAIQSQDGLDLIF